LSELNQYTCHGTWFYVFYVFILSPGPTM